MSDIPIASRTFTDAKAFLEACSAPLLATRNVSANLPLASAYGVVSKPPPAGDKSAWFAAYSEPNADEVRTLVTLSAVGEFPCVLGSSVDPSSFDSTRYMQALVKSLDEHNVPSTRLSSVVGPLALVNPFVESWSSSRKVRRKEKPLLHFHLTYVTPELLRPATRSVDGVEVRIASTADIDGIATMYHKFTAIGPHPVTEEGAKSRVSGLIADGFLYVGLVEGELAGMSCATRPSPGVRAISLVWTNEAARGKGLAEAMVRHTCQSLFQAGVPKVCLNVEPTNTIAIRVYSRVGFVGLDTGVPGPLTEEWMEVGFEDIELGAWD